MSLPRYFGQSTSWKHKDTQSKKTSYIRYQEHHSIAREWEEKHQEVVGSSEREIFFPHGSGPEREPKDNLLSHQ